jgi:hypothetical protein
MADLPQSRIAFEAWYAPRFAGNMTVNMPLRPNDEYVSAQQQIAWMAYKAGSSSVAAPLQAEIERLKAERTAHWTADAFRDAEIERLRAALAELVALKDLKDATPWLGGGQEMDATYFDYLRRKPLAWEAARAALSTQQEPAPE